MSWGLFIIVLISMVAAAALYEIWAKRGIYRPLSRHHVDTPPASKRLGTGSVDLSIAEPISKDNDTHKDRNNRRNRN